MTNYKKKSLFVKKAWNITLRTNPYGYGSCSSHFSSHLGFYILYKISKSHSSPIFHHLDLKHCKNNQIIGMKWNYRTFDLQIIICNIGINLWIFYKQTNSSIIQILQSQWQFCKHKQFCNKIWHFGRLKLPYCSNAKTQNSIGIQCCQLKKSNLH